MPLLANRDALSPAFSHVQTPFGPCDSGRLCDHERPHLRMPAMSLSAVSPVPDPVAAATGAAWSPESWRGKTALQMPTYRTRWRWTLPCTS